MFIADFHIHSKYSRATSRECVPELLEMWARRKGIDVLGTGDFTHPAWREELKEKLVPSGEGLYALKNDYRQEGKVAGKDCCPQFIVSGEISSIYKKNGKVRKVHNLILLPGLEQAELLARRLEAAGNLHSDGRPILGLDCRDLLEMVLDLCPEAIFIPAHIWTPHFSLYGAYSGFDDIKECFEDLTGYIYALETGLSSNPPMNWRLSALDDFALVSNSDAHSPSNLGREANLFDTDLSYPGILQALKTRGAKQFRGTIEFFPEEGKYHYDGHRSCKVCWRPAETKKAAGICPVCGQRLTVGVLHRVEQLADREDGFVPVSARHFESLVPLHEVIASALGLSAAGAKVREKYDCLIRRLGPELFILREAPLKDIEQAAGPCIAEGIRRLRCGQVKIQPGFDGEYGRIMIMDKSEIDMLSGQLCFLNDNSDTNEKITGFKAAKPQKGPAGKTAPVSIPANGSLSVGDNDAAVPCPAGIPYGLNPEQWEAVSSTDRAIVVTAGPGTGKTRTLVCRIAYLVEKCGVHPSQITAVTFTNKAAGEMRTRLEKHFAGNQTVRSMTIGTFHSICLQYLSEWKGRHSMAIIDEYTAASLVEEILVEHNLNISPREVIRRISLVKSGVTQAREQTEPAVPAEIYDLYCSRLARYGMVDYDDILLEALKLFESMSNAGASSPSPGTWPARFSHLLVDEFQDLNTIQYRLLKAWSKHSASIFIIGDPDQSIYGFRGSDFRCFDRFKDDFPGARHVRLTRNYRSTPEIIACAQAVIAKKTAGGPALCLETQRKNGAQVRLVVTDSEFSEALLVAKEINGMVGGIDMLDAQALSTRRRASPAAGHTRGFADIAVLYRTNRQAETLEQCLQKESIPYVVVGRDEFLAEEPVRKTVAFFRFLLNPADIISLRACLKTGEIYPAALLPKVLEEYAGSDKSVSSLARTMERFQAPTAPDKAVKFIEMLVKYEPVARQQKPAEIIDSWIKDNNLSEQKCMELLVNMAVMHQDLESLIRNIVLGHESDIARSGRRSYSPDAVSLMTLHAAKGLEFPVVFLCGANDGTIPLTSSGHAVNWDEERRLFYVGMTRAQDELILLAYREPSPFIADIPPERLATEYRPSRQHAPKFRQICLFDI